MVLVAVREHDAAEGVAPLAQIGEVRDGEIHAGHLVVREEQAAVHRQDVGAALDQHHVEPDLAQAAQRNEPHRGLAGRIDRNGIWSVSGVHCGLFILPPGPSRAQGTGLGRRGGQPGEFGQREGLGAAAGVDRGGLAQPAGSLRPRGPRPAARAFARLLRRWPKAARTTAAKRAGSATGTGGARCATRCSTADSTWGGGLKAPGGTEKARRAADRHLGQHGERAVGLPAGLGGHALGHLLLEHERHLVDGRGGGLDQGRQDGLAHAVRAGCRPPARGRRDRARARAASGSRTGARPPGAPPRGATRRSGPGASRPAPRRSRASGAGRRGRPASR